MKNFVSKKSILSRSQKHNSLKYGIRPDFFLKYRRNLYKKDSRSDRVDKKIRIQTTWTEWIQFQTMLTERMLIQTVWN